MTAGRASYNSLQLELKPGTPRYEQIKAAVLDRKKFSANKLTDSRARWKKMDDNFKAYIPEKDADALKRGKQENEGRVDYITLAVPYTYGVALTAHTYMNSVFLSRNPVYQLSGRHGETQNAIQGAEAILDYQLRVGEHIPVLMNWLFSACKYGVGFVGDYWCSEQADVSMIVEEPATIMGIPIPYKTTKRKKTVTVKGYEGNRLYNISVHDVYPDPRVPIWRFQDGEFFGRDVRVGFHELLEGEAQKRYFNIDVVRERSKASSHSSQGNDGYGEASGRLDLPYFYGENLTYKGPSFVRLHEMVIRVIPSQWGLGSGTNQEKWVFTLADDDTLIGAQPLGLVHNRFPASVVEYGMGAEEFLKTSMIEVIKPLSEALTWLFNSHMYAVRKTLNDVRVVDPSRVTLKDMLEPYGGSIIRLKPVAYGQSPRDMIHQLPVGDPTANHPRDMQIVMSMMERALGVIDDVMGVSGSGSDRQTATEVRTRTGFSTSRMKTVTEYFSAVGFSPLVTRLVQNTQQLMSEEREYRIAGALMMDAGAYRSVKVAPEQIAGFFDFVAVDGSLPIDRLAQANYWKEVTAMIANNPMLYQQWDVSSLIEHMMSMQGERNVRKFRVQMMDPAALAQQAAMGNMIPVGNGGGETSRLANGQTGAGTSGGTI